MGNLGSEELTLQQCIWSDDLVGDFTSSRKRPNRYDLVVTRVNGCLIGGKSFTKNQRWSSKYLTLYGNCSEEIETARGLPERLLGDLDKADDVTHPLATFWLLSQRAV
ncbi:hypothetical protein CBL_01122 [Carabus blaptoides fortunei]